MKHLICTLLILAACGSSSKLDDTRNYASVIVTTAVPSAKCTGLYAHEGDYALYSAVCTIDKQVLYCSVDASRAAFECKSLNGGDAQASAPPAPAQPPAH